MGGQSATLSSGTTWAVEYAEGETMSEIRYTWHDGGVARTVTFVRVEGTHGTTYRFRTDGGEGIREIEVKDFYIANTPVTQSF